MSWDHQPTSDRAVLDERADVSLAVAPRPPLPRRHEGAIGLDEGFVGHVSNGRALLADPATGRDVRPASYANQLSDYVMGAVRSGLTLEHVSEHAVDEEVVVRSPRAATYLGWPLLLLMRLRP